MTYEGALRLFHQGRFRELIDNCNQLSASRELDPDFRFLLAYVLALTDDVTGISSLLNVDAAKLPPAARSRVETTRGIVGWRSGNHEVSWRHLQSGVTWARESDDSSQLAWSYLHLFRFAIEVQPREVLLGLLRQVRSAVIRTGAPAQTAYLHVCVSVLEGERGHLDEAMRHCDIAESILESDPNPWILAASLINRSCVACLRCDFRQAAEYVRRVIASTNVTNHRGHRTSAEIMSGYIHMLLGDFPRAEQTLAAIVSSEATKSPTDAADSLARIYLATGDLDKCAATLERVTFSDSNGSSENFAYGRRWAALTKAKLLLRRQDFQGALGWLEVLERRGTAIEDRPFNAAVNLLTAQALHELNRHQECARRIVNSHFAGIRESVDLRGQFHFATGHLVSRSAPGLGRQLQERATRIWSSQGIVSVRMEMGGSVVAAHSTGDLTASDRIGAVVNCVAAAFDVADNPRLLGEELLSVLKIAEWSTNAQLAEVSDSAEEGFNRSGRTMILRLGDTPRSGKTTALTCTSPSSETEALLITDVFRIGRAAVALEKARQEERKRAALWPSDPIEEQAGALFVAESMQTLLDTARRVATANIPVLITGETGTGKEVLARLIHGYSPRAAKTFLPFNCSATPRDMLDAQLFGHRKGSFTGASEHFSGVIRAAAGGTLFLDEIGESSLDIQPKLLRFLESGEVHPIGDTHPQRVDVRVIAATNADVDTLVAQGRFREDLFYRLNIVRLQIPPLRERRVEIPAFANHYLKKCAKEMGKGDLRLSEETMEYLVLYRWPGNVRHLANEMRRLAALAEPGAVLMPHHLSADIAASRRTVPASDRTLDDNEIVVRIDQPMGAALQHVERAMVQSALARTASVDEAARVLGLSRKGLYLKRLRFGMAIDRPKAESEVA